MSALCGVLVTCAHVVSNAKRIEVTIANQKYPAQVIALARRVSVEP